MNHFKTRLFSLLSVLLAAASAQAATINFSSLETVLADPTDMNSKMTALWTGWATQLYEYNMPFIELSNEADSPAAISSFTMTIGDTNYGFSNEFFRKESTNSFPYPADGSWAIAGFSTPDIDFTSSIADDGDTLIVNFGNGGLQPGETVRFQVDIDRDDDEGGMMLFADYTSVFVRSGGPNSVISLDFAGIDQDPAPFMLPDLPVSNGVAQFLQTPRPYNVMQPIDVFPDTVIDPVPEPSTVLLASLALAGFAARRRG